MGLWGRRANRCPGCRASRLDKSTTLHCGNTACEWRRCKTCRLTWDTGSDPDAVRFFGTGDAVAPPTQEEV